MGMNRYAILRWWYKWCLTRNRWHALELDRQYHQERARLLRSDRELYDRLQDLAVEERRAVIRGIVS